MNRNQILLFLLLLVFTNCARAIADDRPSVIVVVGASGAPEYEAPFHTWADRWRDAAEAGSAAYHEIGRGDNEKQSDRKLLDALLRSEFEGESQGPLWLVLIGHGTSYRDLAKFNLRGPDVEANELAAWLKPANRPLVIINCASSSGPFINRLSAPTRVIITATKSGAEQNYARFGEYLSLAINDLSADLDHDRQVSLLEAYLSASSSVARFYEEESRLATEHALLDDNGDGQGTPASFFRGIRAVQSARDNSEPDGRRAHRFHFAASTTDDPLSPQQLARRDQLEEQIEQLREAKATMSTDDYYAALEQVMIRLARLYAE